MAAFVPDAALYTLGFSISSQREDKKGGDKTQFKFTIHLPSDDFADRLQRKFREAQDGDGNEVFNMKTVARTKRDVSIILPPIVKRIDIDADGITLAFEEDKQAATWDKYSRIWSQNKDHKTRLLIPYKWTHSKLAAVVEKPLN